MRRLFSMGLWLWVGLAVSALAQGEEWSKTFPISGRPELRVNTSDAEIRVDAWDQKSIEARITSEKWGFGQGGIQVIDRQTGDSVELEVRFPHGLHVFSVGNRKTMVEIHM